MHRQVDGGDVAFLGTQLWHGDIAYLAYLAMIIAMSYFTYRWIEKPAREWVRNRVERRRQQASRSIVSA
jgi:peptidoglycan/LPS O-acetylase OafA/YrhL